MLGNDTVKLGAKALVINNTVNGDSCIWSVFKSGTSTMEGNPVSSKSTNAPSIYCNFEGKKDIKLVAISPNSCRDSITLIGAITVIKLSGVNKILFSNIKVYPIPLKDIVNVDLTGLNKDVEIAIYNVEGSKVADMLIKVANGVKSIDLSKVFS